MVAPAWEHRCRAKVPQRQGAGQRPVVLVEKILTRGEHLPDWPADGTTGYEPADAVVGVVVDPAGAAALAAAPGLAADADQLALEGRRLVLRQLLPGWRRRLADELATVAAAVPGLYDVTVDDVDWALTELLVATTVYRAYLATPQLHRRRSARQVTAGSSPPQSNGRWRRWPGCPTTPASHSTRWWRPTRQRSRHGCRAPSVGCR